VPNERVGPFAGTSREYPGRVARYHDLDILGGWSQESSSVGITRVIERLLGIGKMGRAWDRPSIARAAGSGSPAGYPFDLDAACRPPSVPRGISAP